MPSAAIIELGWGPEVVTDVPGCLEIDSIVPFLGISSLVPDLAIRAAVPALTITVKGVLMTLELGQMVRWTFSYFNFVGAPTDPTVVNVKTINPAGTQVTLVYGTDAAIVKDSTGVYHYDQAPAVVGIWQVRGEGTGTVTWAEQVTFELLATSFT